MTTPEAEEIVRRACVKANESIMELTFGCEYREVAHQEKDNYIIRGECTDSSHFFGGKKVSEYGEVFRYQKSFAEENFEILGRPLRLADVLLAIGDQGLVSMSIHKSGDFGTVSFIWEPIGLMKHMIWNLLHDDFLLQTPETKLFLANLLESK